MANSHMTFGVDLLPKPTNTYNLGNSAQKWNLFANEINASELKLSADVNIIAGDQDKFVNFLYNAEKKAGASWRLGILGTGLEDAKYFVIQSGTSTISDTNWADALQIGMNTHDIYIPSTTPSDSTSTGALTIEGGLGVAGQVTATTLKGEAVNATTYNGLTLNAASAGFTIADGATSKTLTVNESATLKAGSSTHLAYYNGDNVLQGHSLAHFSDEFGNLVKDKKNELVLGNGTGKASNGSSWGQLALYSSGTKGTYLKTEENSTAWYTATLPAKNGIIAYISDVTESRVEIVRLTS